MSNNIPEIVTSLKHEVSKKILDPEKKYIRDAIITRRNNINKAFWTYSTVLRIFLKYAIE